MQTQFSFGNEALDLDSLINTPDQFFFSYFQELEGAAQLQGAISAPNPTGVPALRFE